MDRKVTFLPSEQRFHNTFVKSCVIDRGAEPETAPSDVYPEITSVFSPLPNPPTCLPIVSISNLPKSRAQIPLSEEDYNYLREASMANNDERLARRAKFILAYAHGLNVTDAARLAGFSRPVAYRWMERVRKQGARVGLSDKPYEVQERSPEAHAWIVRVASENPDGIALTGQPWTPEALARYVRAFAQRAGFPELSRITAGGIMRILRASKVNLAE